MGNWPVYLQSVAGVVNLILFLLIVGLWKPWANGYGREKGRNLARKEDIDKLVAEMKLLTTAQEEVKSKLSGELWNKKRHWNEKKSIYSRLLDAIHLMLNSCSVLNAAHKTKEKHPSPAESELLNQHIETNYKVYSDARTELIRLHALTSIFASKECFTCLAEFLTSMTNRELRPEDLEDFMNSLSRLDSQLIIFARRDLELSST